MYKRNELSVVILRDMREIITISSLKNHHLWIETSLSWEIQVTERYFISFRSLWGYKWTLHEPDKTPTNYTDSLNHIPREPDKILSGLWGLVAICVTQPLCPFNVPLRVNPSAMMYRFSQQFRRIVHRFEPRWRSMRGKRKRESEGHDFRSGNEIESFEGGEGGISLLHEIEAPTHVRSDVAAAILFSAVEFCIFSTDFYCIFAVLVRVLLLLIQ